MYILRLNIIFKNRDMDVHAVVEVLLYLLDYRSSYVGEILREPRGLSFKLK
jgi:hypothetical protein